MKEQLFVFIIFCVEYFPNCGRFCFCFSFQRVCPNVDLSPQEPVHIYHADNISLDTTCLRFTLLFPTVEATLIESQQSSWIHKTARCCIYVFIRTYNLGQNINTSTDSYLDSSNIYISHTHSHTRVYVKSKPTNFWFLTVMMGNSNEESKF